MRVLAVGAHPDDIELGCAGALALHRLAGDEITLLVMTCGEFGPQGESPREHEQQEAASILGADLIWGGFDDGCVPSDRIGVSVIETALRSSDADLVYTHAASDSHQDHRATHGATLAAARRNCRILAYETPSTTSFTPNLYIDVDKVLETKFDLLRCHMSQILRNGPVDIDALEAQARFRGYQAKARHAEGFEAHRFLWSPINTQTPQAATQTRTTDTPNNH
jgi:LmbE family N-acetylglucosaminyl deacetylase